MSVAECPGWVAVPSAGRLVLPAVFGLDARYAWRVCGDWRPRPGGADGEDARFCAPMKNRPWIWTRLMGASTSSRDSGYRSGAGRCIEVPIGRTPFRTNVSKGPMNARRSRIGIALAVALAVTCLGAFAAEAASLAPLPRASRHVDRHHRLHRAHATPSLRNLSLAARQNSTPRPDDRIPVAPRPRRSHRSATVPHVVHRLDSPRTMKSGTHAGVAVSSAARLAGDARMLERDRHSSPLTSQEHPIVSGRGPPRASPSRPLPLPPQPPPRSLPAPVASRRSTLALIRRSFSDPASRDPGFRLPDACASRPLVFRPGQPLGRPHVRRPEGAATCLALPSLGGSPCFA